MQLPVSNRCGGRTVRHTTQGHVAWKGSGVEEDPKPDDPLLTDPKAPHELSALLRWHRAGVPPKELLRMLGMRGTVLVAALQEEQREEKKYLQKGIPIHSPLIKGDIGEPGN